MSESWGENDEIIGAAPSFAQGMAEAEDDGGSWGGAEPDGALVRGWKKSRKSQDITANLAIGDTAGAAQNIRDATIYAQENPGTKEGAELMEAWEQGDGISGGIKEVAGEIGKDWSEADGAWEGLKSVGRNAEAMRQGIVEQIPNMVAPVAGMVAGGAAGSAVAPGPGTVIGAWAGASAGNTLIEGGYMAQDALNEAGIDPQDLDSVKAYLDENRGTLLKQAGIKGGIIGAVDTATAGIAGRLLNGPARAATSRAMAELGVDVADKAAVKAAQQSPEFASIIANDAAFAASRSGVENIARNAAAAIIDPAGEFAGEYLGSGVATGDWDEKNAALEALSSIGQSGAMYAGQKAYQYATKPRVGDPARGADAPITDPGTQPTPAGPDATPPGPVPDQFRTESIRPSERMGLNPADGPLSSAAAIAVDTGVSDAMSQAAEVAQRGMQFAEPETQNATLDNAATQSQQVDPSEQWAAMTVEQRQAVADKTDVSPVIRRNLTGAEWGRLNPDIQSSLSAAMQQEAATEAPAENTALRGEKVDDEFTAFSPNSGSLNVPRAEMPQVKAEHRGALANFLKARGIVGEERIVPAASLKPTQREFSEEKVQKAREFVGGDRAILASSDGHILDGHHQWMAKRDEGAEVRIIQLDAPIQDLLQAAKEFPSSTVEGGPVLQNRNRATAASIEQMTSIAAKPDYLRLSPSRDFANGAPVVEPGAPVVAAGREDTAVTANGRRIPVQYAVVEAETLLPSNGVDGTANADYAKGAEGRSRAIAGNGRVAGLQSAFKKGSAKQYVEDLASDDTHGIDPATIRGMRAPVLVRIMPREEITDSIGDESNTPATAQLTPSEQSKNDARRVDIRGIAFNDDGEITRKAVEQFVASMPQAEKAGMMDGQNPNRQAYARLENVIFSEAYESDTLLRLQSEATDPEVRTILSGLRLAAGKMSQLKGAGVYDIRALVVEAAEVAVNAKRSGQPLAQYIQQADISRSPSVQTVLESFAVNIRSAKKIGKSLSDLADLFYAEASRSDADMFGAIARRQPDEIMGEFYGAAEAETGGRQEVEQPAGSQSDQGSNERGQAVGAEQSPVAEPEGQGQQVGQAPVAATDTSAQRVDEAAEGVQGGASRAEQPAAQDFAPAQAKTQAKTQAIQAETPSQDFDLAQESESDRQARESREADARQADDKAKKGEEDKAKKAADAKATKQAVDTSVDRFELGQDIDQQLSGQDTMFSKGKEPVSSITGREVFTEESDLFESARSYFKENIQGTTVTREDIGEIRFSGKGWHKLKRGLTTDTLKAKLIAAIPDVVANGVYEGREPVSGRSDDIVAFHYVDGYVGVAGESVQVGVTIGEDRYGNLFYNINHDADKLWAKRRAKSSREEARLQSPSDTATDGDTKLSMADDSDSVNITVLDRTKSQPTKNAHTPATIRAALEKAFPGVYAALEGSGLARVIASDQLPESIKDGGFSKEQTQTAAFKKWFGDSKVVDAEGRPMVVYHGAPDARFADDDGVFKSMKERFGMGSATGVHWFAASRQTAKTYADDRRAFDYQSAEPGIVEAYLRLVNPMIVDGGGKEWREAQKRGKTSDVIDQAMEGGHDGVIIRRVRDNYQDNVRAAPTDTFVVFSSNQIKSATGNNGGFDNSNPDIRYSADGNILAYVQGGKVTFVADNIPNGHNIRGLMLHEIGVHLKQMGKNDKEFRSLKNQFELMARKKGSAAAKAMARVPKDTADHLKVEEAIGYYVEQNSELPLSQKVIAWFRAKIREWAGNAKGADRIKIVQWAKSLSDSDIIYMAAEAVKSAKDADTIAQNDGVRASMAEEGAITRAQAQNKINANAKAIDDLRAEYSDNAGTEKGRWIKGRIAALKAENDSLRPALNSERPQKPSDDVLGAEYLSPEDVPKDAMDWILANNQVLTSDASDAVRWARVVDTLSDDRYPAGDLTMYRAVDAGGDIRPGDWVTTDRGYAEDHLRRYLDGKGEILEETVDGRDVLASPTGNAEEAIYAPREFSAPVATDTKPSRSQLQTGSPTAALRTGAPMATRTRVTLVDATSAIAGINIAWAPETAARVTAVAKFSDLPPSVQNDVREAKGSDRTRGVFHKKSGTVYVIAENHTSLTDLEETIFHEAYGHLGLAGLFGKEIKTKMNQLWLAIGGDKGIRDVAKRNGISLEGYFQDAAASVAEGKLTQEARNQVMMEELLSHLAEDQRPTIKKRIQELMGAFRQWLRERGFVRLEKLSDGELRILLARAKTAVIKNEIDGSFHIDSEPMFRQGDTVFDTPEFKKWFGNSKVVDAEGEPLVVYHGSASDVSAFNEKTTDRGSLGVAYFTDSQDTASHYAILGAIHQVHFQRADLDTVVEDAIDNQDAVLDGRSPNIVPAFLSIQKPIDVESVSDVVGVLGKEAVFDAVSGDSALAEFMGKDYDDSVSIDDVSEKDLARYIESEYSDENVRQLIPFDGDSLEGATNQFRFLVVADMVSEYAEKKGADGILIPDDPENGGNTWIPLKTTQIKSATGNSGQFDPENPDITLRQGDHPFTLSGANPSDNSETGLQAQAILARNWSGNTEESIAAAIQEAKAIATRDVVDWLNTNKGRVGDGDQGVMLRGGKAAPGQNFAAPEETLVSVAIRKIQDKYKVLKDLQANIKDAGGTINEATDAYLAEELFHGKAENDLRLMREQLVEPLAKKLAMFGIESKDLDRYLYAKHAPERNKHIASINPAMPDGGSGMTDAEAAQILSDVHASGKQPEYDQVAQIVYDMLQNQRDLIRNGKLEDDGLIDAWESKYKHYVPLKGWAEDTKDQGIPGTGKGFSVSGRESKRALGRDSEAASPTSYAIIDLTQVLLRKRKNEVGNVFLAMVEANPDKSYWQVFTDDKPETDRRVVKVTDPATGQKVEQVRETAIPMAMMTDRYFTTKKDGKTYYIKLEDDRLMKAMKNLGPESTGALIRTLGGINRILSSLNTSYAPEFVVSNFARDIQTALLNLQAEQSLEEGKAAGTNIALKTAKDTPKAMRAIYGSLRGKTLTGNAAVWQSHFDDFREQGAKTGWFDMKDLDGQAKDLDRLVTMAKGGAKGNAMAWMKNSAETVENLNSAVENAVRLSAYVNAVQAGIPKSQAASLAKNMTVNFNRRGELGTTMNALYMFANASTQGIANFARTMLTLKGDKSIKLDNLNNAQKIAIGIVAGAYFMGMINRAGADDDDDGENFYDKVPDYVKERNIVIMKSLFGGEPGEYWKIPLPYGYNVFYVLGGGMEAVFSGNKSAAEAAVEMSLATLGSFSPIGFQESETLGGVLLKNAMPTIGKPVVDIALNENFMGSSIYNKNFPFGTPSPDSALARRSTPEAYKAVAEWLNEVTGGSRFRPGAIDVNPDVMNYIVDYFGGSAYSFFGSKVPDAAVRFASGVEMEPHRTPFLARVSGKVLPYDDVDRFYSRRNEIGQIKAEAQSLRGMDRIEFMQKHGQKVRLEGLVKSTENRMKLLRKQRDSIYARDIPMAERDRLLKDVEGRMKAVVDGFNRAYATAESRQ